MCEMKWFGVRQFARTYDCTVTQASEALKLFRPKAIAKGYRRFGLTPGELTGAVAIVRALQKQDRQQTTATQ